MDASIEHEIDVLRTMKATALRAKYREVFGQESRSSNRQFLFRRIAWRLQAIAEGGLSERARQRALEIADEADLRIRAPRGFGREVSTRQPSRALAPEIGRPTTRRLKPGTILTRQFENRRIVVTVREGGFEYESRQYRSLSAIAREITGTRWNGLLFFGLTERSRG